MLKLQRIYTKINKLDDELSFSATFVGSDDVAIVMGHPCLNRGYVEKFFFKYHFLLLQPKENIGIYRKTIVKNVL